MLGMHPYPYESRALRRDLCASVVALVLLLIGAVAPVAAQQTASISGLVTDPIGAAVSGAQVELVGAVTSARTAATDGTGRYRFTGLPAGEYSLRITVPGFLPLERTVSVGAAASVVVDVQLEVIALAGIVVSAEQQLAEIEAQRDVTPGGVTILDVKDMTERPINGLADMLRYVPGVWAETSAGADELFFSSRGSNLDATDYDKNGIKLFQDGLPVTAADGNNHNRVIDPLSASYAVMARGANALTYGASTLGGAMDFISPTARNSPSVSGVFNSGGYGPFNGRVTLGAASERLDGLLTVEGRQWDGYRDHSSLERYGIYANGGVLASEDLELRVFGQFTRSDLELPDALTRAETDANPAQASSVALGGNYGKELSTARGAVKMTWTPASNSSLVAGLSYEGQALFHPIVDRVLVDFDGPGPNPPVEVFSLIVDTDHRDLGAMARYNQVTGAHDFSLGVNYGRATVQGGNYRNLGGHRNGLNEYVDNFAQSLEAYVMDRWRLSDRLLLVAGAQYVGTARDVRTTDAGSGAVSNPKRDYNAFNPRAGLIVTLTPSVEAYGNVSRLFEAPTTFEMEDDARGGNATLDPMAGTVAEVGLRSTAGHSGGTLWNWDVATYYARIHDEILSIDDPSAPGNSLVTNVDKTAHAGVEALGSVSFLVGERHRIDPQVSLTLNRFNFADDAVYADNRLPAAPTFAARGELIYRHAGGVYFGPTFDLIGERFADFANSYTVDGYGLMGLRAGWAAERWEVFGEVRNVFDTAYVATLRVNNVAAADARALYPGTPRAAYVGMRFSF